MFRVLKRSSLAHISLIKRYQHNPAKKIEIPHLADAVVIGGGSAGCHTLYCLAKRGVKAVLLERSKLTSGTTWHTAGLIWSFRMSDIDIQLLGSSRQLLKNLEKETGIDPGWIQNGTLFIAHTKNRMDEYKRMAALGAVLNVENKILDAVESKRKFPFLNEKAFLGALYSPEDGVIDPTMLCNSLTQGAKMLGAQVFENCPVNEILTETNQFGIKKVCGVRTPFGTIKTNTIVNATGAWAKNLVKNHGIYLPLMPMRHSYVVSEPITGIRGMPNIRDHDLSIYFRIQGESICMGGYEDNPIIEENIPNNFEFSLYDLNWSVFDQFIKGAIDLCPEFGKHGIKSTICGPESFTPDHRPIMGPDPNLIGLIHNFGFNSSGMMFGGGCAEQIAAWIIDGQPNLPMHQYDVKRFSSDQCKNSKWVNERSHESYVKSYNQIFPHAQRLSGRNLMKDSLHIDMLNEGAFMEEINGWERPGFFMENKFIEIPDYDWYGSYGHQKNLDRTYWNILKGDLKYDFSDYHVLIGNEVLNCRNTASLFNLSSTTKLYLYGPESKEAVDWIFTNTISHDVVGRVGFIGCIEDTMHLHGQYVVFNHLNYIKNILIYNNNRIYR